jgi:protein CpxP
MSNQTPSTPSTPATPASPDLSTTPAAEPRARRGGMAKYAVLLAMGLGILGVGAFATNSFSQNPGFMPAFGPGPGFDPSFGHGPGFWGGGPGGGRFDPARAAERADHMVRHIAVEIDATADQQQKLRDIAKNAVKDMLPLREKMAATRQQARDLLLGQTVDRAAIEKLRSERIATMDALSKRMTQALTDAAEVLTPEQRHKLSEIAPPHGHFWHRWFRG